MNRTTHDILVGHCRETLYWLPSSIAHCCVTSPPYWGLRDYQSGSAREIGSEPTLEDHLRNMVDVFREVRRVLRDDGVCWVNYGDAFFGSPSSDGPGKQSTNRGSVENRTARASTVRGFKPKDLLCLPHRVAMALQSDGWYLRQCVIWAKVSPMPESVRGSRWERCRVKVASRPVPREAYKQQYGNGEPGKMQTDIGRPDSTAQWQPCPGCPKCRDNGGYVYRQSAGRPTTAHEFVFLMTKSPSYYYAMDENRVAQAQSSASRYEYAFGGDKNRELRRADMEDGQGNRIRPIGDREYNPAGRNLWSYWTDISPSAFKDSHFATMPLDLARRCTKLGTSSVGVCSECGAQWAPVVDSERKPTRPATNNKRNDSESNGNCDPERHVTNTSILGHRPTCQCNAPKAPAVVLDPFGGAGTTAIAARELGCSSIICELNEQYVEMVKRRERTHFNRTDGSRQVKSTPGQLALFGGDQ